ncbi:MAG: UV damage repair protein UvrX [Bacillota bacterium]
MKASFDYANLPKGDVLCIDMKSFYASVEAVERGLDPFQVPLAIVGHQDQKGSVILASTPPLKEKYNIRTGNRLFEVPKVPEIMLVEPRMSLYIKRSLQIVNLLNSYVPRADIFIYSIDESWLDLDKTKERYGGAENMVKKIKLDIDRNFGLACSAGIGPNMFLAKVAMDIEGKKTGLANWRYEDVQTKLWPLKVNKVWGIGKKTANKFNKWQIYTMGDVARRDAEFFRRRLGVVGEEIYQQAWGIDYSIPGGFYEDTRKSIGRGATLYQDYTKRNEIRTVIFNLSEEIGYRSRQLGLAGTTVSLNIRYNRHFFKNGFQCQRKLTAATNLEHDIMKICEELLTENYKPGAPVRKISISLGDLIEENNIQLSLFNNKEKAIRLAKTRDKIRDKYGPDKLDFGLSQASGSIRARLNSNIGGHNR